MIVFLGMPKTGSSWLYKNLKQHSDDLKSDSKEPHIFDRQTYFSEDNISQSIDFTTFNWAMDKGLALQLNKYVTHYILLLRNPLKLAESWHYWVNEKKPVEETLNHIINSRMCDFGSILERWFDIGGRDKVIIDLYENLQKNQDTFFNNISKRLNLGPAKITYKFPINKSKFNKNINFYYNNEFLINCLNETKKFENITGLKTGYIPIIEEKIKLQT